MRQEFRPAGEGGRWRVGFDATTRGMAACEPRVGKGMWDTLLLDPDGYQLHFESVSDSPEETLLSSLGPR